MKVTNIFVTRMRQVFLAVILLVVFIPFASQTGEINQHNSDCVTVMRQRDRQARKFNTNNSLITNNNYSIKPTFLKISSFQNIRYSVCLITHQIRILH